MIEITKITLIDPPFFTDSETPEEPTVPGGIATIFGSGTIFGGNLFGDETIFG